MKRLALFAVLVLASVASGETPTKSDKLDMSSYAAIDSTFERLADLVKGLQSPKEKLVVEFYLKGRLMGAMDVAIAEAKDTGDKATAERHLVAGLKDLHGATVSQVFAKAQKK